MTPVATRTGAALVALSSAVLVLSAPNAFGRTEAAPSVGLIGFSYDGTTWSGRLDRPLFSEQVRWVPGDERTARVWVRNQASETATMSIRPAVGLRGLGEGVLRVWSRVDDGPWHEVSGGSQMRRPVDTGATELRGGGVAPVDLRVSMREDATNASMTRRSGLDFIVQISDARAIAGVESEVDATSTGTGVSIGTGSTQPAAAPPASRSPLDVVLPQTGSPLPPWAAPVAAGLLALGLAVLLLGRRRPVREDPANSAHLPYSFSTPHVLEVHRG